MAGWERKPKGWEETNNRYKISKNNKNTSGLPTKRYNAIIVMAGGLDEKAGIHPWVRNRLDVAIELYRKNPSTEILCTGGGTYHKPPALNNEGFVIHEATACAEYLMKNGVPSEKVLKEWGSYDTIASVYFCLLQCIIPREWSDICVITSSFHMPRVKLLFRWICSLYCYWNVDFVEASDDNLDQSVIKERVYRERSSVRSLEELQKRVLTKKDFNIWLFSEHKAYSCNFYQEERDSIPDRYKQSY